MIKSTILLAPVILILTMAADLTNAAERNGPRNGVRSDATQVQAQAQTRDSRRRNQNANRRIERLFNRLDTDDSGVVTLDEFLVKTLAKAANQFDRIDTDDDALISLEEFLAIHQGRSRNSDIDVDALRACMLENSDIPESDLPEAGRFGGDRPNGSGRFIAIDTNEDGFIDLREFEIAKTEKATNKFNRIDANGDGGITLEELIAAFEQHRERRAVRRACAETQRDVNEMIEG